MAAREIYKYYVFTASEDKEINEFLEDMVARRWQLYYGLHYNDDGSVRMLLRKEIESFRAA